MTNLMSPKNTIEFLDHSNRIEGVYGKDSLIDALRAWDCSITNPITLNKILTIHKELLLNLNPGIAGKWRDCAVRIGGRICPFLDEKNIIHQMTEWMRKHSKARKESDIKRAHIAFERIHPFRDGNGRVGRIIMNRQRLAAGLPLLVIHEGKEQQEYYDWFRT